MKTIKFTPEAIEKILSGRKTTTRRMMKEVNFDTELGISINYIKNDVDTVSSPFFTNNVECKLFSCRFGKKDDILKIEGTNHYIELTRVYCQQFNEIDFTGAFPEGYDRAMDLRDELERCYPSIVGHNPWLWVLDFKLKETNKNEE